MEPTTLPGPPELLPGRPDAVIDLQTDEGVALVGGAWRYRDAEVASIDFVDVGPDLGQGYIVDSFMVVVFGGVGQLAGTVYAALTLGFANKFLEAWSGAVLAKIAVLVFVICFIQRRPQGLFALKGRAVEA